MARKGNLQAVNPALGTPLLIALDAADTHPVGELVKLLLARGADVNLKGSAFEGGPIVKAAVDLTALQLLLDSGRVSTTRTKLSATPMHVVCNSRTAESATLAQEKVEAGKRIKLLQAHGFQLDAKNANGETGLNKWSLNLGCRLALIEAGADVNTRDALGDSPLHASVFEKTEALMTALIARRADVHAANGIGSTPLHEAALHGEPGHVRRLLQAGAKAQVVDRFGWTPLALAVAAGKADNATLLKAAK